MRIDGFFLKVLWESVTWTKKCRKHKPFHSTAWFSLSHMQVYKHLSLRRWISLHFAMDPNECHVIAWYILIGMNPTRNQGEALPYRKPLVLQLEALKVGFPVPKGLVSLWRLNIWSSTDVMIERFADMDKTSHGSPRFQTHSECI